MVFTKKRELETIDESGAEVQAAPVAKSSLPHRFVMDVKNAGCERSFQLIPERRQVMGDGTLYKVPHVRIAGRPIPGQKGLYIIDMDTHPAVNRVDDPKTPDELAKLIMANKRYTTGKIYSWEEWQERLAFEKTQRKAHDEREAEFEREMKSKFGKRGAAMAG